MKDRITEILYNHFGWQRKLSIEKAVSEIATLYEAKLKEELIKYHKYIIEQSEDCSIEISVGNYLVNQNR